MREAQTFPNGALLFDHCGSKFGFEVRTRPVPATSPEHLLVGVARARDGSAPSTPLALRRAFLCKRLQSALSTS